MNSIKNAKKNCGYVALISVIIVSSLLTSAVFATNASSFSTRFNVLDSEYKAMSLFFAKSCRDIALLKITANSGYEPKPEPEGDIIALSEDPEVSCAIVSVARGVDDISIKTSAHVQNVFTHLISIIDTRGGDLTIFSSGEVSAF